MSDLNDHFDKYEKELNLWIESLGVSVYQPNSVDIENILCFDRDTLRERSSVQLSEDSVMLSQYALFLQQKSNECVSFLRWAKYVSAKMFGDDKTKLTAWTRQAECRNDRISYIARRIELMSQNINNLVRARYNEGKCT